MSVKNPALAATVQAEFKSVDGSAVPLNRPLISG